VSSELSEMDSAFKARRRNKKENGMSINTLFVNIV
jgi:hypothetical protein